ncbi:MAG TPA: 23S rRNA (pseudouridine(1915)-N(3))-methyltransferase RlmH [Stellaceae bacterium]|jgi:23S rRNA (pseudouridine1915-N3)-methyltransferase|nr:23S rRNA (pseudouridine(1915)-N(3))-methyltransferase RlmH [Stellaceae bacterium]
MRHHLLTIGRMRRGPLLDLQSEYAGRLIPPPIITELDEKRPLPEPQLKAREAALLLGAAPEGARLVALDGRGHQWSSRDLATHLRDWADRGVGTVAFAIGGAGGLGDEVLAKAETTLSLGSMTWPHFLARIMLLEQLYRAQQILAGHPYHRE